jgi:hypothetical protein
MARGDGLSMEGGSRCVSTARIPSLRSVGGLDIMSFINSKVKIRFSLDNTHPR